MVLNKALLCLFTIAVACTLTLSFSSAHLKVAVLKNNHFPIYLKSRIIHTDKHFSNFAAFSVFSENEYVFIQFDHIPSARERAMLEHNGIKLLNYIPEKAWIAHVKNINKLYNRNGVTFFEPVRPDDKISPHLLSSLKNGGKIKISVKFFSDVPRKSRNKIMTKYNITGKKFNLNEVKRIASEKEVKWIQPVAFKFRTFNDGARADVDADTVQSAPYNLLGTGVVVAEWDNGWVDTTHDDFSGRVIIGDTGANISNHSTHVAGTLMGDGNRSNGLYRGMAPNATLISYEWPDLGTSEAVDEANDSIANYGAVISQNSWGYDVELTGCDEGIGNYDEFSQAYDNITRGMGVDGRMTVVFAAGNERDKTYCNQTENPYNTTAGPGGTAKNVITVGAVNSNDNSMTSFSSWGPTDDGRIKPDVVAPGCQTTGDFGITSTITGNAYGTYCGTSQAAPVVSGVAALIYEKYRAVFGNDPLPSTVKAIMIHTAEDLNNTGPDYTTGWGLINATKAIDKISENANKNVIVEGALLTSDETDTYYINVPPGQNSLKITLVWDDYPADISSSKQLVNDLDLIVTNSSGSRFYPWTLDKNNPSLPAVKNKRDNINNEEQVDVTNPNSGVWIVEVNASALPYANQTYSLVADNEIKENIPIVTLNMPEDSYSTGNFYLDFNCSASSTSSLENMTLYTNVSGVWGPNTTVNTTGTSNSSVWNMTGLAEGWYVWNCLVYDNLSRSNWALQNKTFKVARPPTWSENSSNIVLVYSPNNLSFFNITWNDDSGIDTVFIEGNWSGKAKNYTMYNSSGVYQYNVTMTGGDHYWRSWADDIHNNWDVSNTWYFTVQKLNSSIALLMNGTNGNLSILEDQYVNITTYSNRTGNISVYSNNLLYSFGESPLTNISLFADPGIYNITAVFNENENYSSNWTTHWLEVNDTTPPNITGQNIFPPLLLKSENVSIWANITDNVGLSHIHYNISNSTWSDVIIIGNLTNTFYNRSYNTSNLSYGVYNVSVFANDTSDNNNTVYVGNFTISPAINFNISIFNSQNISENATEIRILYTGTDVVRNKSENISSFETILPKGVWKLTLIDNFNTTIRGINLTENSSVNLTIDHNITKNTLKTPPSVRNFINVVALDVDFNFSSAQIKFQYNDSGVEENYTSVWSCHSWNIYNQNCSGSWENITSGFSTDSTNNIVALNTTNLSSFALAQNKYCGDDIVDSGENCDGSNLSGNTCISLGYAGGILSCTSSCTFNKGSCYSSTNNPTTTSTSQSSSSGISKTASASITFFDKINLASGSNNSFNIYVNNTGDVELTNLSIIFKTNCSNCNIFISPRNQIIFPGSYGKFKILISVNSSQKTGEYYLKLILTSDQDVSYERRVQLFITKCNSGEKMCEKNILKECIDGEWISKKCNYLCVNNVCIKPETICKRGDMLCKNDKIVVCRNDQRGWNIVKKCPYGCAGAQCKEPKILWVIYIAALLAIYSLISSILIKEIIK